MHLNYIKICDLNFITDTKVEWKYLKNSSKVVTKYNVITKNMETGANGGRHNYCFISSSVEICKQ